MNLQELKKTLGILTLEDLEQLNLIRDDKWDETVKIFTTSEENDKAHNEATWIASVNSEDLKMIIITNGMLYDDEHTQKLQKDVEIGRVFINEEKADMLTEALKHSFPKIVSEINEYEHTCPDNYELVAFNPIEKDCQIDEAIQNLEKYVTQLNFLKNKGFNYLQKIEHNTIVVHKNKN